MRGAMSRTNHLLSRLFRSLRRSRILMQESGIAAVEFSLILPILVVLWIGGVEITSALSVDRRLNNLASSMGDLVARSKQLTYDDVDAIFDLKEAALFPYSDVGTNMRVTAVKMDGTGSAKVAWSRAEGTYTAYAVDTPMNDIVPETLRTPNTQIIMSEVYYTYTPAVGYIITGNLLLEDRMFFVPRLVTKISLCSSEGVGCVS